MQKTHAILLRKGNRGKFGLAWLGGAFARTGFAIGLRLDGFAFDEHVVFSPVLRRL
jgi:hypothetical protein